MACINKQFSLASQVERILTKFEAKILYLNPLVIDSLFFLFCIPVVFNNVFVVQQDNGKVDPYIFTLGPNKAFVLLNDLLSLWLSLDQSTLGPAAPYARQSDQKYGKSFLGIPIPIWSEIINWASVVLIPLPWSFHHQMILDGIVQATAFVFSHVS